MAITSAICSSFKQELLQGKHNFESSGGHTFKIALFTSSASLGAGYYSYSTSNEISNTSGSAYSAGGATLTNSRCIFIFNNSFYRLFRCNLLHLLLSLQTVFNL